MIMQANSCKDPEHAFNEAIKNGVLSSDESLDNYAGNYMYMSTENGVDKFKNIITRKYKKNKS